MGGETLGPVQARYPSIGECWGDEAGVSVWVQELPHRSSGERRKNRELEQEKSGKGIIFKM